MKNEIEARVYKSFSNLSPHLGTGPGEDGQRNKNIFIYFSPSGRRNDEVRSYVVITQILITSGSMSGFYFVFTTQRVQCGLGDVHSSAREDEIVRYYAHTGENVFVMPNSVRRFKFDYDRYA